MAATSSKARHPLATQARPSRGARGFLASSPSPRLRGEGWGEGQAPRVCVGVITGPQGVHGAVRIRSFTEIPEDIGRYGPLTDETGRQHFGLRHLATAKGVVIAQLSGIENRDQAERLRGLRLYLPRSALPRTEVDEYYHADLIGLEAVLSDGTPIGRVRAIHDFGAGDTLELARPGAQPVMVPFTRAIVPTVDPEEGRLVIEPPPGLLDDGEP
jgi:16S rRNA processing protein RimM